jgi:alkylation response protein AidB-like acyl-CoA dehydrogenase
MEPAGPRLNDRPIDYSIDYTDPAKLAEQRALQRKLFEAGYAGLTWPAEYGGRGLTREHELVFAEESRPYRMPNFSIVGLTTFAVCGPTLLAHGSPELLARHIPRILAGDELVIQFFSEPAAGSDLAGIRTRARRDGDSWVLSGSKIWSSGAYYADYGLCLARTDWDLPKHAGLTWFLVPVNAPGLTLRRIRQITGNAEFCEEFFDDVVVSDGDRVGEVNAGWGVARTMLVYERGSGALAAASAPQPMPGVAPDLARLAGDVGNVDQPEVRRLIATAHVHDLARRALRARIGALMAADPSGAAGVASYSKLSSGIYDPIRAGLAMRIAGPRALGWDGPGAGAETALGFLDSRFAAIAGGTCEVQRNAIGERVLGLPKEPSFDQGVPFRQVVADASHWTGTPSRTAPARDSQPDA